MKAGLASLSGATKLSLSFSSGRKKPAAGNSVDAGMAAPVSNDKRPTMSRIDPINMKVGDLALQFKDGGWTSTDTAGNSRTLTVPPVRPDTSLADAAEIQRVKKENEALRGEVCTPRRTPHWLPARCADLSHMCHCVNSVQNNLLKFKIELLVEMLTVANLDSDKLEDEKVAAENEREAAVAERKRLVADKMGPTS